MCHAGAPAHFWPLLAARHMIAISVFMGPFPGIVSGQSSKKERVPSRAAHRDAKVVNASGIEIVTPPGAIGQPSGGVDAGTSLNAELDQLRQERDSLTAARSAAPRELEPQTDAVTAQRAALKQQLDGLITELARRPKPEQKQSASESKRADKNAPHQRAAKSKRYKTSRSTGDGPKPADDPQSANTPGPVDSMALAQALFRTGDYEGALKAFDLTRKTTTDPRDRMVIKYFSAACLGKLGNAQESTTLFREVANSKADEVLAECAQWQLSTQQWRDATKARIAELRSTQTGEASDTENQDSGSQNRADDQGQTAKP
jgi:hypothetical protein